MEANNEALYIRRDTVTEQRHPEQQSAEQGKLAMAGLSATYRADASPGEA